MAESVSLHLRPIISSHAQRHRSKKRFFTKILAVTHSQILLQQNFSKYRIGVIGQSENGVALALSSRHDEKTMFCIKTAEAVAFADPRTLCVIEQPNYGNCLLRVIRAVDDFFNIIVARSDYPFEVTEDVTIKSLEVHDGQGFMTSQRVTGQVPDIMHEFWKFEVPDPTSSRGTLKLQKCGSNSGSNMITSETNGRLHVCRINQPFNRPKYRHVLNDLKSGRNHTFREHDAIQIFEDAALLWSYSCDQLGLSILRLGEEGMICGQTDYTAPIPLPESNHKREEWRTQMDVHIAKGSGRFFLRRNGTILMGYLPGVDVPLEDAAASDVWRSLHPCVQEELLSKNLLGKRQIWLRAVKEED